MVKIYGVEKLQISLNFIGGCVRFLSSTIYILSIVSKPFQKKSSSASKQAETWEKKKKKRPRFNNKTSTLGDSTRAGWKF